MLAPLGIHSLAPPPLVLNPGKKTQKRRMHPLRVADLASLASVSVGWMDKGKDGDSRVPWRVRDPAWRLDFQNLVPEACGRAAEEGGAACGMCAGWTPRPRLVHISSPARGGPAVISGVEVQRRGGGKLTKGESGGDAGWASNMCPLLTRKTHEKGDRVGHRRRRQQGESRAHGQGEPTDMGTRGRFRKP